MPHVRKPTKHYTGQTAAHIHPDAQSLCDESNSTMDTVNTQFIERFEQAGFHKHENELLHGDMDKAVDEYPELNSRLLQVQLAMFGATYTYETSSDVASIIREMVPEVRGKRKASPQPSALYSLPGRRGVTLGKPDIKVETVNKETHSLEEEADTVSTATRMVKALYSEPVKALKMDLLVTCSKGTSEEHIKGSRQHKSRRSDGSITSHLFEPIGKLIATIAITGFGLQVVLSLLFLSNGSRLHPQRVSHPGVSFNWAISDSSGRR
ncbi:hypothetical protein NHX12_005051, partial [Muraenolepis orangiensis]